MSIAQIVLLITAFGGLTYGCGQNKQVNLNGQTNDTLSMETTSNSLKDTATLGSGCFWCTEAIFQSLNGVESVVSGYSGGITENPDYKQVCTGQSGHAEVVQVVYDPKLLSFTDLLEAFWSSHDPTTLNRQGNDVGTQYRSVIFYHSQDQKIIAENLKKELNDKKVFDAAIVTEISPAVKFYKAENYHQQYFELNGNEPYCTFVIKPKLEKFKKAFQDKLKK
ncbi:MAG: peptide-methionine (S)-S-oxide reductase MsrA [Bacteroidetes bacterium]|nr:peptide-methionine (S)-S-oxide reductase MsrA [Bacteroidota bacterium]